MQLKATVLAVLDAVRDGRADAPVRLVFEPKTRTVEQQELANALLRTPAWKRASPINLTMSALDGRPSQKACADMLTRVDRLPPATVERRTRHRSTRCRIASTSSKAGSWCC